jgi:hypothetical protein
MGTKKGMETRNSKEKKMYDRDRGGGGRGKKEDEGRRKGKDGGMELGLGWERNRRVLQTSKGGPHLSE